MTRRLVLVGLLVGLVVMPLFLPMASAVIAVAPVPPPRVKTIEPPANTVGVWIDPFIVLEFTKAMKVAETSVAISLQGPEGAVLVDLTWTRGSGDDWERRRVTIRPRELLAEDTAYRIVIGTGGKDYWGADLAQQTYRFVTSNLLDSPRLLYSFPATGETGVDLDSSIVVGFSRPMKTTHMDINTGATAIDHRILGRWTFDPTKTRGTWEPASDWHPSTSYWLNMSRAPDARGRPLPRDTTVAFRTEAAPPGYECPGHTLAGCLDRPLPDPATAPGLQVSDNSGKSVGGLAYPPPELPSVDPPPERWYELEPTEVDYGQVVIGTIGVFGVAADAGKLEYVLSDGTRGNTSLDLAFVETRYFQSVDFGDLDARDASRSEAGKVAAARTITFHKRDYGLWRFSLPASFALGTDGLRFTFTTATGEVVFPEPPRLPAVIKVIDPLPPEVTWTLPLEVGVGEETWFLVEVTDDVGVWNVSAEVVIGTTGMVNLGLELVNGTGQAGTWRGILPASLVVGTTYLRVIARDTEHNTHYPEASGWGEVPVVDRVPPLLEHRPPAMAVLGATVRLVWDLSDTSQIATTWVEYAPLSGEAGYRTGERIDGLPTAARFETFLPARDIPGTHTYRLHGTDRAGNTVVWPTSGWAEIPVLDTANPVAAHRPPGAIESGKDLTLAIQAADNLAVTSVTLVWGDHEVRWFAGELTQGRPETGIWEVTIPIEGTARTVGYSFLVDDGNQDIEIGPFFVRITEPPATLPPAPQEIGVGYPEYLPLLAMAGIAILAVAWEILRRRMPTATAHRDEGTGDGQAGEPLTRA